MFSENDMPHYRLSGMLFSTFSDDEILQLSVKEITNPQSFDSLMHPTFSGLYDPALGPSERDEACSTCGQNLLHCPGHMGHIQLPVNVYNPVFFKTLFQILRGSCFHCHHLYASKSVCHLLTGQLRLLHHGCVADAECLRDVYGSVLEETGGGAAMAVVFEERMNDYMTKALKDSSNSMPSPAKHVMDCRQRIIKDFIKTQMGPRGGKCPHCKKPLRPLRHEHNSKIYFSKTISRKTAAQIVMDNQERRKSVKREPIENSEEFVADAEILEMNSADTALTPEKQKHLHKLLDQMYVTPLDAQTHLRKLWAENGDVLQHLFGALRSPKVAVGTGCPTDIFFLHVVPVPPSRFRPVAMMKDKKFENPQTANLSRVISDCLVIKQILAKIQEKTIGDKANTEEVKQKSALDEIPGKTMEDKFHNAVIHLQTNVNCVIDSGLDKLSKDKTPGIKQLLEKKEGLFRKHMMGKRVDYAARSVISPDPYIGTNEIGVPDVFAKKLTYPQPVTPWNVQELRQAVINGPLVHPGAAFIVNEDGSKSVLSATDRVQREAMAKQLLTPSVRGSYRGILGPKKVYRHLKNGDVLLLNRQPTLHRPSIQAHRARVLPGEKTLRLHYANCKAYNADFDGDEMNAHFPQNEVARAEAYTIASTDYQYLVPKDGTPLAGLIQDHMVSGTSLTIRGRSFDRWDYQQLVYGALTDKKGPVRLLRPSIVKPVQLWSGKQVVSTVLLNLIPSHKSALNLEGKAKVPGKSWIKSEARPCIYGGSPLQGENMGESQVIIRQGELLCGVLDKAHYGSTPYGLVHCCYEVYGGRMAGQLLTCLARLFTIFLQIRGFSLGVEDILCTPLGDLQRRRIMKEGAACGPEAAAAAMDVADPCNATEIRDRLQGAHLCKDDSGMKEMDLAMKSRTDDYQNKIAKCIIPNGLLKRFPDNNLQLMVQSGAKGSAVNCMQISCLLGQIELEGRRPPIMLSGRSLPSFLPYDTSPRAGGYIDGRFLTGIRPQEYFFHCMAGREGLVDTAVKTSRSGYLQRCIIKHLEGIIVNYDLTARDSDGSVVQFQYGEDGLDILKTQFLQCKQYPFLISNQEALIPIEQMRQIEKHLDTKLALKLQKQVKKWKKKHGERDPKYRTSGFLRFCALNPIQLEDADDESRRDMLVKTWRELDAVQKERLSKKCTRCPNPVLSRISTFGHFGAISENMADSMEAYIRENPDKLLQPDGIHLSPGQTSVDRFRTLVNLRYLRSLVEPGEAVGLLAAQSIGEPSTQMTLNTFHFAGRGEMNVTLGIPRLREILMVASANIKTPAMDVPVHCNVLDKAQRLKQRLNRVFLSQVLEKVNVCEYLSMLNKSNRCRMYRVRFHFLPRKMYEADFHLTPAKIIAYMERKFVRHLCDVVKKKVTDTASERLLQTAVIKARFQQPTREDDAPSQPANEDEDVSDDDQNDGDAAATKYRERQQQERDYAGEEEERQEMGDSGEAESDADLGSDEDNELMAVQGVEELPVAGAEVLAKKAKKGGAEMREMDATRLNSVLSSSAMVAEYKYDVCREEWCEVTLKLGLLNSKFDMTSLIETEARRSVVYQTPGIARCFLTEVKQGPERGTHRLKTEGVNMMEIFKYDDVLDLDRLYSNDIHAVANMYGIEAAGRVIVKEIKDVFAAYGIEVDPRHLSLVADYMTFEGVYKPFNRIGMESSASPLQKMSFETTMHFLKSATLSGDRDDLKSPSARIVAGQLVSGGTGCFDLLQPLN